MRLADRAPEPEYRAGVEQVEALALDVVLGPGPGSGGDDGDVAPGRRGAAELTTAVKYRIPVKHVLLDNHSLGKIAKEQRAGPALLCVEQDSELL